VGSRDASGLDPVLDISAMELDQLLRLGIAEAQLATVARVRRDRVLHIHTARSYLMAALKKNGGSDPDLRAHLLAVLLKLGMESRAMQGITFEGGGAAAVGGQAQHNTPAKGPTASSDNTSSTSTPEEVIVRSDSDHSSKDADESVLRVCRFDAMKEHLLSDDSQVESFSVTSPKLAGLTHPDALLGESSEEGSFNASLATERREVTKCLRAEPLSIVDEHEHSSACLAGLASEQRIGFQPAGADPDGDLCTALERLNYFYEDQHLVGGPERDTDDDPHCTKVQSQPTSPISRVSISRSPVVHNAADDFTGGSGAKAVSAGTRAPTSHYSGEGTDSAGETRESYTRLRAVQPQQISGLNLGAKERKRQSKSLGSGADVQGAKERKRQSKSLGSGADVQGVEGKNDTSRPQSPNLFPRHTGRQPSQSLPDMKFAASVDETAEAAGIFGTPQGRKRGTPPWTDAKVIASDDDRGEAGQLVLAHVVEEPLSGGSRKRSAEASLVNDAVAPSLKRASPLAERALRNPLSRLELFSGGEAQHLGIAGSTLGASPVIASPSLASLSICGSMAPSLSPSPFCTGAVSREQTPSLNSLAPPSDSHVRVKVLNGITGDEEALFTVPEEATFSEKQFLTMLDWLCKQHAGQTLSDLNWLSQARPGARLQRRKCDMSLVEELFADRAPGSSTKSRVLLLCTVPVRPPSELPAGKVRLKSLVPDRVAIGATPPVRLRLDTSVLEAGRQNSVAFTHQWSNKTYSAEANPLGNLRGVEFHAPWQILAATGGSTDGGLYDVHLVIDRSFRSENRKTLTVGSPESEFSSSSTALTGTFMPIGRCSNQSSLSS